MRKIESAPSVLSLDYSIFEKQCADLNQSSAHYLHFDVMDGHFVPNLTFGPDILKGFRKACPNMILDVHLMVDDPDMFIEAFVNAGADLITFHYEACTSHEEIKKILAKIHSYGIKAGLVIKPKTDVSVLFDFLDQCDLILVMSVEPGFGGQKFMESSLDKVKALRKRIDESSLSCLIEIDGGINDITASFAIEAGADVLVAGSYVFKGDIQQQINHLYKTR